MLLTITTHYTFLNNEGIWLIINNLPLDFSAGGLLVSKPVLTETGEFLSIRCCPHVDKCIFTHETFLMETRLKYKKIQSLNFKQTENICSYTHLFLKRWITNVLLSSASTHTIFCNNLQSVQSAFHQPRLSPIGVDRQHWRQQAVRGWLCGWRRLPNEPVEGGGGILPVTKRRQA